MRNALWPFLSAGAISFALAPLVARLALRLRIVSHPVHDRWHRAPTPLLGGVAIAAGTLSAVGLAGIWAPPVPGMIAAGTLAFVLGLIDDRIQLGPTAKLVGSLAIGGAVAYLFNGPNASPGAPTVLLAVLWFAGIVHAFNLLDNMDGLATGVAAIVAVATGIILTELGQPAAAVPLAALAGALAGFLPWNSYPARMFMGDGGSLFIGSILGAASLVPWFAPGGGTPSCNLGPAFECWESVNGYV